MSEEHKLLLTLENAAEAVAQTERRLWPGWICYVLEALEDYVSAGDYLDFLRSVQEDVALRLELGRW